MFCPKCGSILLPKKENNKRLFKCPNCSYKTTEIKAELKETSKKETQIGTGIVSSEVEHLPKTEAHCPKCGHDTAYCWTIQTRAADEPETRFFKCEKCKHVWREYE